MSDLQIVGIIGGAIVLLFFIGCVQMGRRIAVHLNAPPRRADKDLDKIIEDRVEAILASRDAR